jgi:hypothetical protein
MAIGLTHLRSLLGDEWVKAEVFGNKHSHLLGLWQQKDPDNLWLKYTEELLAQVLTNPNITLKHEALAAKLNPFRDSAGCTIVMRWQRRFESCFF